VAHLSDGSESDTLATVDKPQTIRFELR